MAEMAKLGNQRKQTESKPCFRPAMFASLVARMLLEEVAAGRWQKLPDGRLVPIDVTAGAMVESEHGSAYSQGRKEGKDAAV